MNKQVQKLLNNRFLYLVFQLSKPVMGFLILAGVLYLDNALNMRGCRFILNESSKVFGGVPG